MSKNKKQYSFISDKFIERLTEMFGVSVFHDIEKTFVERRTTFRVNTLKATKQEITEALSQSGFKIKQVPWYTDAFILQNKSKRELTDLDIYKQGKIYIQSLASMIPPLVLDPQPGEKVLDLTAAPGSKTSQIAMFMNKEGELVANDNNKVRFFKLKHNMELLGVDKEKGKRKKEEEIGGACWSFILRMEHGIGLCKEYPVYFDKILLDAPCSAETRFLTDKPKTFSYWSERKVKEMAYKQSGLLRAAWEALKLGGTLVYSTCTFAPEENELQITKFLERNDDAKILDCAYIRNTKTTKVRNTNADIKTLPIVKEWKNKSIHIDVVQKALRIMPTKEIEGFFVAKLRKIENI